MKCTWIHTTGHLWWQVNIGSCNDLVPSGRYITPYGVTRSQGVKSHSLQAANTNPIKEALHNVNVVNSIKSNIVMMTSSNNNVWYIFPSKRPVVRSFDVFFDLRLNKRSSKQSWGWWFETLSRPLWRYCNGTVFNVRQRRFALLSLWFSGFKWYIYNTIPILRMISQ